MLLIVNMGKETFCCLKYNQSKLSTPTLKKYVLSSSADNTSSASTFTRTFISSQLDNKDITKNQNKKLPQIQMTYTHV